MRVLLIGGSGHVGSLIGPRLAAHGHTVTVFDRTPPPYDSAAFVDGSVTDGPALQAASADQDAVVYLAMGSFRASQTPDETAGLAFDVNAKGVWLACDAAVRAGIRRFIYTSSLSVYADALSRPLPSEDIVPDAVDLYGLTKTFGEMTARRFALRGLLDVFALRLCFPVADAAEVERRVAEGKDCALTADETAAAFLAALDHDRHAGFAAVHIVGRHAAERVSLERARTLLGWEPEKP